MTQGELAHLARAILMNRREREAALPADLFTDYAWEALLHLFVADARRHPLTVASLAGLVRCPDGVMERWVRYLAAQGLVATAASGTVLLLPAAEGAVAEYLTRTRELATGLVDRSRETAPAMLRSV